MEIKNGIVLGCSTAYKFARLYPNADGIKMVLAMEPDKNAINRVVRYNNGAVYMQDRLYRPYKLTNNTAINRLSLTEYFIPGNVKPDLIPGPFKRGIIENTGEYPVIPEDVEEKIKHLAGGKVSLGTHFAKSTIVVELHRGGHSYVDIKKINTTPKPSIPGLKELQEEYGTYLNDFTGDAVRYWMDIKGPAYSIPSEWLRQQGFNYNGGCRFVQLSRDHIVLIPMTKICEFDGHVIDPLKEKPEEGHLCKECAAPEKKEENVDILALMKQMDEKMDRILALQRAIQKR